MNDRPTPETDAFSVKFKSICGSKAWVPTDICRRLEHERDEAREALADWENAAAHVEANHPDEVHCGCVPVLRKLLTDARKERDVAREDLEFRRGLYKVLEEANNRLRTANEEAVELAQTLKQERDEARDFLRNESWRADGYMYGMDHARRECANLEEIIRGEWPEDQAYELIRNAKEAAK